MKVGIDCKDRKEAALLKAGMDQPVVKALVLVMGALAELPTDRARRRVLAHVQDQMDECEEINRQAGA